MKKVFLDTNIVADILLSRMQWLNDALNILKLVELQMIELYCTSLSFGTLYYILHRNGFLHEIILEKLKTFRTYCHVLNVDESDVDSALNSSFKDFEDAMQYFSALREGCDVIITRNKKDFAESKIQVLEPQEFLDKFCKRRK